MPIIIGMICCDRLKQNHPSSLRYSYQIHLRVSNALYEGGLISIWLYKDNNKLQDIKKCIYSTYSPLSPTHL
jgi:hypothetical protein